MRCFNFSHGEKCRVPKTTKFTSGHSFTSLSNDGEVKRSGSELYSQNTSDFSTESSSRNSFPSSSRRSCNLKVFTLDELKLATKNFSRSLMIGEGGFGRVYRGVIRSSEEPQTRISIAVKQLGRRGLQGYKEWVTEVNVLEIVEHPNLVKLVGCCAEDEERLLVYEYMPNLSVQDHLCNRFRAPLPWSTRLRIAQDAACGLAYLHEGLDFQIIFRDFKSSNILLDDQWNAKLSDFGLARLGPSDGLSHVSTVVVGTIGYAAPEYVQTGRLTAKSDVWSYGVFLLELITGRRPFDPNRPKSEQNLLDWVKPHLSGSKKFELVLDPRLKGRCSIKTAQKLAALANRCLARQPKARPKMTEVLDNLTRIVEDEEAESPQHNMQYLDVKDASERSTRERLMRKLTEPIIRENRWLVWCVGRPKPLESY
ncbi:Serine/threonine-protein kinase pcrk1 [Ancistrocladus abbreviatus]